MARHVSHMVHWLVIIALIASMQLVPVQAANEALQQAAAAQMAAAMADMPCGDEMAASPDAKPCDCCTQTSCDLSACLGVACLQVAPGIVPTAPPPTTHMVANAPVWPSRLLDTPLRPPIA